MKISPLEIRQQEFTKKMRGFDPDEVQSFLESLADELQKLNEENESLKSEVESLTEQINEFKKIEKNLQDTLLSAQESSAKAMEATKKQTGLMIVSSWGLSPFGFLIDHCDCTRNAAWKYVSGDLKFRSIRIADHCGTVTPVVSFPHDSVIVFVSKPEPIALRTGGNAASPMPA